MIQIHDNLFDPAEITAASQDWPSSDWEHWIRYDSSFEKGKLTCEDWKVIPQSSALLLCRLLSLSKEIIGCELVPDGSLRGGGMQCMTDGGRLDIHFDSSHHGLNGWQRRLNAILFLQDWNSEWGGAFELWNKSLASPNLLVYPSKGRLLIFETSNKTPHGVSRPLSCPVEIVRQTLAVWWYTPDSYRARAEFLAFPDAKDPFASARLARAAKSAVSK